MKMPVILFMISSFLFPVFSSAQENFQYQRKALQPDFFVPQGAVQQQENLPAPKFKPQPSVPSEAEKKAAAPIHPVSFKFKSLSSTPRYKQNYDIYLDSLKDVAETGKISRNPDLEDDLSKMNSDEKIIIH